MAKVKDVIKQLQAMPANMEIMLDIWTAKDVVTSAGLWNLEIDDKDIPNIMTEVINGLDPEVGITFDIVSEACLTIAFPSWDYDEITGLLINNECDAEEIADAMMEAMGESMTDEEKEDLLEGGSPP